MFCDLVGSTEIASHLDPEEWREIVREYHRAAAQAIERFGGSIAQYLGDGVMAYFGYPEAHDNDAERAVRASLAILDAIAKLNEPSTHPRLAARIGIDSGAVVVGSGAAKEADVYGDTPNIAARVQAVAEPGTVVVTDAVHRLVSGLFVVEDHGAQALKGIERPVRLYRVVQPSGVRGRLEAVAASRGLTPFVGREDELRLLMSRWELALEGEGQVALIIGEAGIGKSRLVQRFHEQLAGTPHTWVEAAAGVFFQNTPFYAVTEMLRELLAWRGDEPAEERLARLEPALELAGLRPAETLPLIAPLLNLPIPPKCPLVPLSPEQQRRRSLTTLVDWALGAARVQPMVVAIEDLHWVDPSTLELLQLLVGQGAMARLLLLYTARPEFRIQWPMRAHHTQITLNRLTSRNVRTMVEEVAAQKALSKEIIATVVERTGGVPLFVEELTRAVLESGNATLTRHEIPVTLRDSLMARLDRLGPAKEVAQVGAVIGTQFSYELLHAVHPIVEEDLQHALRSLTDAELLYVRGIAPEATYEFKHALIQDAAYEALLKSRRQELHRRVAQTITDRFGAVAEAQPHILARHWTGAGEAEPAIAAWEKAGEAAYAREALVEAGENLRQALAMLNTLPESAERDARELKLARVLVSLLQRIKGYSAAETVEVLERARTIAEKTGNLAELVLQRLGTWAVAATSGNHSTAIVLADQILDLAQREGSHTSLGLAHNAQVMARWYRGDLIGVEEHFGLLSGYLEAAGLRKAAGAIVFPMGYAGINAWVLGYAERARARIAQSIAFARDSKNPFDQAVGRGIESYLYRWLREPQHTLDAATQAVAICEKHSLPLYRDFASMLIGWARAQLGSTSEGVSLVRKVLASLTEAGSRSDITNSLTILAEAQALDGKIDDALRTIEDALHANPEELPYRPNILTWRGELRVKIGQTELAEADFREAIALAREMSAKAFELRATMSLAWLLDKQGHREEARTILAEIYYWFTEGFDTADLKDAKALLDDLNRSAS